MPAHKNRDINAAKNILEIGKKSIDKDSEWIT